MNRELGDASITVIIPVYNNPEGLARTLASIGRLEGGCPEVIVADDGSAVSHEEVCRAHGARLVRLAANAGPGAARNEATRHASGAILAFTDSDCTVPPNWLTIIRREMDDPTVVAVAGGYSGEHVDGIVPLTRFMEASFYHLQERALVNTFVTANFAVRADVFREVGGFPAEYFGEDLIFGLRLKEKGHAVVWLPELRVGQFFRASLPAYFRQQMNWSMAALIISVRFPQTESLAWSVRRSSLKPQLVFELLLVASLLALPLGVLDSRLLIPTGIGIAASLAGLASLNLAFFGHIAQQRSLADALRVMLVIVTCRNLAWLAGCLKAAIKRPGHVLPGVARMLFRRAAV